MKKIASPSICESQTWRLLLLFTIIVISANNSNAQIPAYVPWSTFLSGSGTHTISDIQTENGFVYVVGSTNSTDFPTTTGAYQTSNNGLNDLTLTKFDPAGNVVYSTYIGGTNNEAIPKIRVKGGEVYLGSSTLSTDFPVTPGAYQTSSAGNYEYAFSKFDASGNLVYSTYLGGSSQDILTSIEVDNGEAYVAGRIRSTDFPITPGAFQSTAGGGFFDYTLTKFDNLGNVVYSTYYGGNGFEFGAIIEVENGEAYLAGYTSSNDLITTPGTIQPTSGGSQDGFLAKFDASGNAVYSTYLGGSSADRLVSLDVENGEIYLTGSTASTDFPVTANAYQPAFTGSNDAFYTKIGATGNLVYSTYLGGTVSDIGASVRVENGEAYISGTTNSNDFPISPGTSQSFLAGVNDIFLSKFDASGSLLFSTYLGGSGNELTPQMEVLNGEVFLSGTTPSPNFPVSPGSFQPSFAGLTGDMFFTKFGVNGTISYSTYLGGSGDESSFFIAQENQRFYIAGSPKNSSTDYPVTAGAFQTTTNGQRGLTVTVFDFCPVFTGTLEPIPVSQTTCQFGLAEIIDMPPVAFSPADFPEILRDGVVTSQPPQQYIFYQWQIADSPSGPWDDLPAGILEDYLPSVGGTDKYYRRIIDAPWCDATFVSDVAAVLVNDNVAPVVDGGDPIYICAEGVYPVAIGGDPTGSGGTGDLTYDWDNTGGFINDTGDPNPVVTVGQSTIFTVTVTDELGCQQIGQSVINVIQANAGPDVGSCEGLGVRIGSAPLAGVPGVTYSWVPSAGLSCDDCAQPIASPDNATEYTLTITIPLPDGGSCTTEDVVFVDPVFRPGQAFAGPDRVICIGNTAQLGSTAISGFNYTWAPGNYLVSNNMSTTTFQSGNLALPVPDPITYQLTAERLGCTFVDDVEVAVIEARDDVDGCGPRTIGLPDRTPNIDETYTWELVSGPGGFTGPTNIPVTTVSASIGGTSTYRLTVSYNGTECTEVVVVPPCGCVVEVRTSAPIGCPSFELNGMNPVTLTASAADIFSGDPNDFTYTWEPCEGLSTCTGRFVQLTDNVHRTYTVTMSSPFDPNFMCTASIEVNHPAWSIPVFNATDANVCPADQISIGEPPVAGYSYLWYGPNDYTSSSSNPNVTAPNVPGTYNYTAIVTDVGSGCRTTDVATLDVEAVFANAGPDWVICDNAVVLLGSPDFSGGVWEYSWEPANAPWEDGFDNTSPQPEVLVANNLTFILTVTNPETGCEVKDTVEVIVDENPMLPEPPDTLICLGSSVQIGAAPLPGVEYSWSPTSTLSCSTCPQPTAFPTSTTIYTLTATFPGNCGVQDQVTVTVNTPDLDLGDDLSYCPSDGPVNIGANAPTGIASYSWSPTTYLSATDVRNPTANPPAPITYTLTITNDFDCTASDQIMVSPLNPAPAAGSDATICLSGTAQLGNAANTGNLIWSPAAGLSCTTCPNPVFTPTAPGTFEIVISQDVAGCVNTDTVVVIVNDFELPTIPTPSPVCQDACVEIGIPADGGVIYSWSPTAGLTDPGSSTTLACPSQTTEYTLTAINTSTGCIAMATVTAGVVSEPAPEVTIPELNICLGSSSSFMPQVSPAGDYDYSWSPTAGLSDPYSANPTVFGGTVGQTTFSLQVTNKSTGCGTIAEGVVNVDVDQGLTVDAGTYSFGDCSPAEAELNPTIVGNVGGINWTTNGDGSFIPSASDLNATYEFGTQDSLTGSVTLTISASSALCGIVVSDETQLSFIVCPEPACSIEIVSVQSSECNISDNTYTLDIDVMYNSEPGGDINIKTSNGADQIFSPDGSGNQTFTLTSLHSYGAQNIDVIVFFVDDNNCTDTLYSAYNAPETCAQTCEVSIDNIDVSACDFWSNKHKITATVTYTMAVISPIVINGNSFTPAGLSGTEIFEFLEESLGGSGAIIASIEDGLGCIVETEASYDQPEPCKPTDPAGFIYCPDGGLLTGGTIDVTGPGLVLIEADGSNGYYKWFIDGESPGTYTMTYTPPGGYVFNSECLEQTGTFDPTPFLPDTLVTLGSDTLNGKVVHTACDSNKYYLQFDLEFGDPWIELNNLPIVRQCDIEIISLEIGECDPNSNSFFVDAEITYNIIEPDSIDLNGYKFLTASGNGTETFHVGPFNSGGVLNAEFIARTTACCAATDTFYYNQPDSCISGDPMGFIFCSENGKLVEGGTVEVSGPGAITYIDDGSTGEYQWITDGTEGVYCMTYNPPPGYMIDPNCLPQTDTFDITSFTNPYGNPEDTLRPGFLTSMACTEYWFKFEIQLGDTIMDLNNIALIGCPEICGNGCDDDGDGKVDYFDSDCACENVNFFNQCDYACTFNPGSGTPFTFQEEWKSVDTVPNYQTPLVADVDNDGMPEVIMMRSRNHTGGPNRYAQDIVIMDGATGQNEVTITTPFMNWNQPTPVAVADIDDDGFGEIIIATASNSPVSTSGNAPSDQAYLFCYEHDGTLKWKSDQQYGDNAVGFGFGRHGSSVGIADFNKDSIPEVWVFNEIFNAETGVKLADGGAFGIGRMNSAGGPGNLAHQAVADLTGNLYLELAAGNTVYEVLITNTSGTTGNTMTPVQIPGMADGYTSIADMDGDGLLDVVATTWGDLSTSTLYAWNPRTVALIDSTLLPNGESPFGLANGSIPSIGDLDSDCEPEVVICRPGLLLAYEINAGLFSEKWRRVITENSGQTGATMFDFNQDGQIELVHRDQEFLRIIDGSGSTAITLDSIPCESGTGVEMPIVADVDMDMAAELIVGCRIFGPGDNRGRVCVYEASYYPWAPARMVWNQLSYHAVNINDDLSVPLQQQNHAVFFDGGGCNCTEASHQPLNAALQQATFMDSLGCPVWPAADATIVFTNTPSCKDSLVVLLIQNNGDGKIDEGTPIAIYRGDPEALGELMDTIHTRTVILPGGSETVNKLINILPGTTWPVDIYAAVNDTGSISLLPVTNVAECNYNNNENLVAADCGPLDFGDLPDLSAGMDCGDYQTINSSNGPSHVIIPGLKLGISVDEELDGNPDSNAQGDDDANGDDENGLALTSNLDVLPGGCIQLPVSVINSTGKTAHLEGWIDWNCNGDLEASELIVNESFSTDVPSLLKINVPADATLDSSLGFRLRLSNQDNMTPYGLITSGEVEDYMLQMSCGADQCIRVSIVRN